jgi:hypothetical protein
MQMDERISNRHMVGGFVFLLTGPILWAGAFTVIYGAQSSLCAFGALPQGWISLLVIAATVLLMLADVATMLWPKLVYGLLTGATPPETQWPFIRGVMRLLAALALLAMGYFVLAAATLPACAIGR